MKTPLASLVFFAFTSLASPSEMLVTPAWLLEHQRDGNLVLLHVGSPAEYDAGHIPGAEHVTSQDLAITSASPRRGWATGRLSSTAGCRPGGRRGAP